jgi:arsenical pump membrane protein
VAGLGLAALAAAALASPAHTRAALGQDWSPFVLVVGLLLVGRVADQDGLFAAAGRRLARLSKNGALLFLGASLMIGLVTAILNLDTSVAFLTPVLVYTARSRGGGEAPLLYGCLLLSNAGSLFLPGSNLTNLIVLGHLHLTGAQFFSKMWLAALAAILVTAAVIIGFEHRSLMTPTRELPPRQRPVIGLGLVAMVVTTVLVLTLRAPALPVFVVGIVVVGLQVATQRQRSTGVVSGLGAPVLTGLFGLAVALGALGRTWTGPATLLSHLDGWGTAAAGAVGAVVVNNLPAASLLSARTPGHPFALLVGLNLGPNLFVSGSLAWLLWWQTARNAGATPRLATASRIGVVVVPLSMGAALGVLALTGSL